MKRLSPSLVVLAVMVFTVACTSMGRLRPDDAIAVTGTYGDMFRHAPSGDIIGVELRIVETSTGLQGTLQVGRGETFGGLSGLAVVDITLDGDDLSFSVPESHPYRGRFEGKYRGDAIVGRFELLEGREEFVVLQRGESFWD